MKLNHDFWIGAFGGLSIGILAGALIVGYLG